MQNLPWTRMHLCEKCDTLLDLCMSSLRRGHANHLCIVPILTDDLRRGSKFRNCWLQRRPVFNRAIRCILVARAALDGTVQILWGTGSKDRNCRPGVIGKRVSIELHARILELRCSPRSHSGAARTTIPDDVDQNLPLARALIDGSACSFAGGPTAPERKH